MSAIVFDTLENVKKLKAVGLSDAQAETQTRILADLVDEQRVTKPYLDMRLKEVEHRIDTLESRLIIRLGAMMVVAISIVATLVKIL